MAVVEVDPREIIVDEFIPNVRGGGDIEHLDVDDLIESIREEGLLQSLTVRVQRRREGGGQRFTRYFLVAGFRRLKAIRALIEEDPEAFETVPCTVFAGDENDALLANLAENIDRVDLTPMDIAARIYELQKRGIKTDKIANRVKRSTSRIYALMRIYQNATPQIKELLQIGEINTNDAAKLAQLPTDEQNQAAEDIKKASNDDNGTQAGEDEKATTTPTPETNGATRATDGGKKTKQKVIAQATNKARALRPTEIKAKLAEIPTEHIELNAPLQAAYDTLRYVLGEIEFPFDHQFVFHPGDKGEYEAVPEDQPGLF